MKSKSILSYFAAILFAFFVLIASAPAQNSLVAPATPTPTTFAQIAAGRIKSDSSRLFAQLLSAWRDDVVAVWNNPNATPQQVFDQLGTQGGATIDISSKTAAYLESLKPGCTSPVNALIGTYTVNTDGTVTAATKPTH